MKYANVPMRLPRAKRVASLFRAETGAPCIPICTGSDSPDECGFDCMIPMEYLEELFVAAGKLRPRRPD